VGSREPAGQKDHHRGGRPAAEKILARGERERETKRKKVLRGDEEVSGDGADTAAEKRSVAKKKSGYCRVPAHP